MRNSSSIVITRNEKEFGDLLDYVGKNTDYTWPDEEAPSRSDIYNYKDAKEYGYITKESPLCVRFNHYKGTIKYGSLKLYKRNYPHLPFLSFCQVVGGAIRRF